MATNQTDDIRDNKGQTKPNQAGQQKTEKLGQGKPGKPAGGRD